MRLMKYVPSILLLAASSVFLAIPALAQLPVSYDSLVEGQEISGFRAAALYLNDAERPIGGRFIHERSGFTLDLLSIESVPQALVCVTTFPTSDMGEPHTQEHLLLGKGNMGRTVASGEPMALATSTAFTAQWRTCYSFYTSAGTSVFYDQLEGRLDALLHPDYTDEEIRREVRNFGVHRDPDGTLGLEEKGTVYAEMVSSMDQPSRRIYRSALQSIYGPKHPLSYSAGGMPEALRVIEPSDIRAFHRDNYHLANIGAVVSLPGGEGLEDVLGSIGGLLDRVEPEDPGRPVVRESDLPPAAPADPGEIVFADYPHQNPQQPGDVWLAWPADRTLDIEGRTLLRLFLGAFAGDATTNLYKRFIDSSTREIDLGAQSVFGELVEDMGFPLLIGFGDVPVARMNTGDLTDLRSRVLDEIEKVAGLAAGSPELEDFNSRVSSRVVEMRRNLSKFVNSPPEFGVRGVYDQWIAHLHMLNGEGGFRKSVTLREVLDDIEALLNRDGNMWGAYLSEWRLQTGEPWLLAARPVPALVGAARDEREARLDAEVERLEGVYGVADRQVALARYSADYDRATAEIEEAAARVAPPRFVDDPPMTLDDQLQYQVSGVGESAVPIVASTFDTMTSATVGVALRLDGIVEDRLLYLSALPQLLTRVGVIENGEPVSFEDMSERLRNEILSLNAGFGTNPTTERIELVVRGAGNNVAESDRAIEWIALALFNPDWRRENLGRIRDLLDQILGNLERTTQGSEESWVRGVYNAYWRQTNPLYLATTSFMTRAHDVFRLRWMLKEATGPEREGAAAALAALAERTGTRAERTARLAELEGGDDPLLSDAAEDLLRFLDDVPDSSLDDDWRRLCREMAEGLRIGPDRTLAELDAVRRQILRTGNARLFLIASDANRQMLTPAIERLVGSLDDAPREPVEYARRRRVDERLRERDPDATNPLFVGLINPNSQSGVFQNSAPMAGYRDTDPDALLDYLSANLYAGGGGHTIFMKTWSAGLAYSNGIRPRLAEGRLTYYAERTPELPQTLQFVIDELERAEPDTALVDYAIAQAFRDTRSHAPYESRGESMAADLADDLTPETVARFHEALLRLRTLPELGSELYSRMHRVYATVLPGMRGSVDEVADGIYFVIGPEPQFAAWEEYLQSVEGDDVRVYRLFPRDFWR